MHSQFCLILGLPAFNCVSAMQFWHNTLFVEKSNPLKYGLGSSLGTTLRNATQAKRASQGFIGQAERTRGTK